MRVGAQIVRHQQPDDSSLPIDDRTRIAASVGAVVPDDLGLAPSFAAVVAALQKHIDSAGVAAAVLASLAKREQHAALGRDQRRDAVSVVAALARDKNRRLFELRLGGAWARQQ